MKWYSQGIPFQCQGCGTCCQGSGFVLLSKEDIKNMAHLLSISIEKFLALYTRKEGDKIFLQDSPGTEDCIFLKEKKCQVYLARPVQCKTFPFWPHYLDDKSTWKNLVRNCKGAHTFPAPIISEKEIEEKANEYLKNISLVL